MIIGIQLPEGAEIEITKDGKALIIFDEKKSKRDLWKASLDTWLTEGQSSDEFWSNECLDNKCIELSYRNKLKFSR